MNARRYIPDRGDIVRLELDLPAEHLPALVVSPKEYNRRVGLAQFCPVTSAVKGYPFEVLLPEGGKISGAVLSDQIRSFDWRVRNVTRISRAPAAVTEEVMAKISTLLGEVL